MRDFIFQELRECNRVIGQNSDDAKRQVGEKNLLEIVDKMCELSNTARTQGLLALEEELLSMEDIFNGKYLKYIIMSILEGSDPTLLEELNIARYCSANLTGYEALHYLVMFVGCGAMQEGERPEVLEKKLWAMIPEEVKEKYHIKQDEEDSSKDLVEQYCHGEIAVNSGDEYYLQIKAADYVIKSFDDGTLQRVLRDVDNSELVIAMKALSGEARHHVFNNLSRRLAEIIAEDMEYMGTVDMKSIASSTVCILRIIASLISMNEIKCTDREALSLLEEISDGTESI